MLNGVPEEQVMMVFAEALSGPLSRVCVPKSISLTRTSHDLSTVKCT